jgi:hypothetical protein
MEKILIFLFLAVTQSFAYAQEEINFEFSFPENSRFTIEQNIENSGTMKITGSNHDVEALKKAGYNKNRKLKYLMKYTSEYTTEKKTTESFPFEFFYSNINIDIDSDGKKQQKEGGFASAILKGNIVNGKLAVVQNADTGSSAKNQFIDALPKYFTTDFPKLNNLKIGESFIVNRSADNKTEGYSFSGSLKYILTKIENELAYFSILVIFKNDPTSILKSSGSGNGEMIYNHKEKFIQSEKIKISLTSSQDKDVKIIAENVILSSYELKNLVKN